MCSARIQVVAVVSQRRLVSVLAGLYSSRYCAAKIGTNQCSKTSTQALHTLRKLWLRSRTEIFPRFLKQQHISANSVIPKQRLPCQTAE